MKKNILIIFIIVLVALVAIAGWFLYNQKRPGGYPDLSKISDSQIIALLNKNSDAKDYIKNHSDFKIIKKEILTKESIVAGQNGANFREVFWGLELQNNRYMRVELMNLAGTSGLVAVIDFKTNTTPKAFGLLLLGSAINQNGQTNSQTTNK